LSYRFELNSKLKTRLEVDLVSNSSGSTEDSLTLSRVESMTFSCITPAVAVSVHPHVIRFVWASRSSRLKLCCRAGCRLYSVCPSVWLSSLLLQLLRGIIIHGGAHFDGCVSAGCAGNGWPHSALRYH